MNGVSSEWVKSIVTNTLSSVLPIWGQQSTSSPGGHPKLQANVKQSKVYVAIDFGTDGCGMIIA